MATAQRTSPDHGTGRDFVRPEDLFGEVVSIDGTRSPTPDELAQTIDLAHKAMDYIYKGGRIPPGKWMRRLVGNLRKCKLDDQGAAPSQ